MYSSLSKLALALAGANKTEAVKVATQAVTSEYMHRWKSRPKVGITSGALLGAGALGTLTAVRNSVSGKDDDEDRPSVLGSIARGLVAGGTVGAALKTNAGKRMLRSLRTTPKQVKS